jgi:agmatinase
VTFLGVRAGRPGEAASVAILGIPRGVDYPGIEAACADAPAAIRQRSQRLAHFADHWDFDLSGPMIPDELRIVDCGDVRAPDEAEATVRGVLAAGGTPIVLGGDDSVPIPMLRAFACLPGPISVLQVDAHLDFRDQVAGVRDGYSSGMRRASEMTHVEGILQVGMRGVGSAREADLDDARAAGNQIVTARELRARGAAAVAAQLPEGRPLVVSFDLDGLDPSVAPGVRALAPGGLSYEEACDLLTAAAARAPIVGAAFTELAPALDVNGLTALVAVRLITHLLRGVASTG